MRVVFLFFLLLSPYHRCFFHYFTRLLMFAFCCKIMTRDGSVLDVPQLLHLRHPLLFRVRACWCLTFSFFLLLQCGDRSFPLEAVKQLKRLMNLDDDVSRPLAETSVVAVCAHPLLPQVLRPVCQEKGAAAVFSKLGKVQ